MKNNRASELFMELVKVDSESRNEGRFQAFLQEKCQALGLHAYEDDTEEKTGLGAGNLICTLKATDNAMPALMFCCHSDTVVPGVGIQPVLRDGNIYSDGDTILAADDKAGIAICLEMAARLKEANARHGKIEFIFTVGEEIGLVGANALDMSKLSSRHCYVLDGAGPVGAIIVGSPTMHAIEATFHGKTAHAGLEPEKGISAIEMAAKAISKMRLGRIDAETTANIGTIHGGTASNIVADEVKLTAEVRSISHQHSEEVLREMLAAMDNAAREMGGSVEYKHSIKTMGFRLEKTDDVVKLAMAAIQSIGRTPVYEVSGGASDANAFSANGIETTNLSIGYEKVHTTEEYIPVEEMEKAVEVAYFLATNHF